MTRSKLHTEDPQILGVKVQNLVTRAFWRPEFLHICSNTGLYIREVRFTMSARKYIAVIAVCALVNWRVPADHVQIRVMVT